MDYRLIYKDDKLIGYIAQDKGEIIVHAVDKNSEMLIATLITPIKVDIANVESDVSVSNREIIMLNDERWLSYLEYDVPYNYYISPIKKINKATFKTLRFDENAR